MNFLNKGLKKRLLNFRKGTSHQTIIFRNMAKLVAGDGIARVIGLVTMPIITRIYLPEHLGVLTIFISFIIIIAPLATFRYSLAIPLPKNDGLAFNLIILSITLLVTSSILLFFVFFLWGKQLLHLFSMDEVIAYWYLIPLAFIGTGLYELLSNWAIRERSFRSLAKTKVWQKVLGASVKISLGLFGLKPIGLLIGQIFTQAGGVFSLFSTFRSKYINQLRYVSYKRIIFLGKRFSDFPKFRIPAQILLAITSRAPILFFAWYFGAEITGQVGLATMMLSFPVTLIGYTTGKAYYGEIALIGKKNKRKILRLTKEVTKKLFIFSILPFVFIFLFGPWLFQLLFGKMWYEAGLFARILSIYLFVQFVYSPISEGVFSVFEEQAKVLIIEALRLFLISVAFLISYFLSFNPTEMLIIYSSLLATHYLISILIVFNILKK